MSSSHSFGVDDVLRVLRTNRSSYHNWKCVHSHVFAALTEFRDNALSCPSNEFKRVIKINFHLLSAVSPEGAQFGNAKYACMHAKYAVPNDPGVLTFRSTMPAQRMHPG